MEYEKAKESSMTQEQFEEFIKIEGPVPNIKNSKGILNG
jgi:hypothetical protein